MTTQSGLSGRVVTERDDESQRGMRNPMRLEPQAARSGVVVRP